MAYWLSIQYPVELGNSVRASDNDLWIKELQQNTYKNQIQARDIVVVYERGWRRGDTVRKGPNAKETAKLEHGRKVIRAIVEVCGQFISASPYYYEDAHSSRGLANRNRYRYVGKFKTKKIPTGRDNIGLTEIQNKWISVFGKKFSPRINGGFRKLSSSEWRVIATLIQT